METKLRSANLRTGRTRIEVLVALCALLLAITSQAFAQADVAKFEAALQDLITAKANSFRSPKEYAGEPMLRKQIATRDFFLANGVEGARFLVYKLKGINSEERAKQSGPDDAEGAAESMALMVIEERAGFIKYEICAFLADIYPRMPASEKQTILDILVDSFTPSTQGMDDIKHMDADLFRLGRDGMAGFLWLANSDSKFNRCHAADVLYHLSGGEGPRVDCNATEQDRLQAISDYKGWVLLNPAKLKWPSVPSYFDPPVPAKR